MLREKEIEEEIGTKSLADKILYTKELGPTITADSNGNCKQVTRSPALQVALKSQHVLSNIIFLLW